ncbi:DUF3574 domain-containing protein [Streptomyces changanensis]|uniref:Choline dehydrogenase n=2 Tax=Streptomyces TaxID=1883 RepID=A0A100Y1L0_9ACTN|nr:DUF3574 domain-containing protein [Streptomyces kanasensis]KUH36040.1 choline dehydrogenase [Streptomyces kanasensis]UUS34708.1 DUF3574 domain-containing protein [Streptomyces changanensis]
MPTRARTRVARGAGGRGRTALAAAALLLAVGAPTAYVALDDGAGPAVPAAGVPGSTVPAGARAHAETRLLFGTERPDGGPAVTDRQFTEFVDRVVTPLFPAGLTVQEGRGQWRDGSGRIQRERSYELVLLYPAADAAAAHPRVERVRDSYRRAFGQESVARVDDRVRVDF